MAVASIICYLRAGQRIPTKRDHKAIPAATDKEMEAVKGEVPALFFDAGLILELDPRPKHAFSIGWS